LEITKELLTEEQASKILPEASKQTYNEELQNEYNTLRLLSLKFKPLVIQYLKEKLGESLPDHPDNSLDGLILLAMHLAPEKYENQVLDLLDNNTEWGKQWIRYSAGNTSIEAAELMETVRNMNVDQVLGFYKRINKLYPNKERPKYPTGIVYEPDFKDGIYTFKDRILNHLAGCGADGIQSLCEIQNMQRDEIDLSDFIKEARNSQSDSSMSVFSLEEIRQMAEKPNVGKYIVHSIEDFLKVVLQQLDKYQDYLQGDCPARIDLWDQRKESGNLLSYPKDEIRFSDHIKRYLDLTLSQSIISNREVEIRHRSESAKVREAELGAEPDLLIQFSPEENKRLTLCIEVKCNWNAEAKNAIENQLIKKYLAGGTVQAGILLLGWYDAISWDKKDARLRKSTSTWKTLDIAKTYLEQQAQEALTQGYLVSLMVINCGLPRNK